MTGLLTCSTWDGSPRRLPFRVAGLAGAACAAAA